MTMPEGARTMGDTTLVDNWTVGADSLLMEIMETQTRKVFLCQQAVTPAQYRELEPPEGFVKSGLGRSVADVAYFRRSPGAPYDSQLPEGWSIRSVTLAQDLVAEIPYPARVCFLRDGSSFHGPVRLGSTDGSATS
jgi:hypothetical protein